MDDILQSRRIKAADFTLAKTVILSDGPRSLVFTHLPVMNGDYRDEIELPPMNHGRAPVSLQRDDRIAQLPVTAPSDIAQGPDGIDAAGVTGRTVSGDTP
ncbi:hypothetical protein ACXIUS_08020 [Bosea thiooxidans]|nr:hypothetical protein [Bosea sp. (in: a-proteobacteria)]